MFITATPAVRRSAYGPALRSLDRFLDETFTSARSAAGAKFSEDDTSWTLSLDLPGVSREQLTIAIDGQDVKIETVEGAPRQYKKAYEFPQTVDAAASTAKLENGVLTLTLAKVAPAAKAVTLNIN
ncbi:Hsp20/alpha crystallin family protein [Ottowia thiooxydans]|uniref:Hsp20/alpha crystallin family protein n=1 Tax=Ottowia thiooxydans TaxID=219182 RepID=UPI0004253472|nr:Hsp20/alpha crystallin family protein [Ottowia thiooxydans]